MVIIIDLLLIRLSIKCERVGRTKMQQLDCRGSVGYLRTRITGL